MIHKHHIIPKHAGGSDDPSNIIELTVAEHAEAHRILFETYNRWEDYIAWQGLAGLISKEEIVKMQLIESGHKGGSNGKGVTGNRSKGGHANWEKNKERVCETLANNAKLYGHLGGKKSKGTVWYHNNEVEIKISANSEIPDGYVVGRLPMLTETKQKLSESTLGKPKSKWSEISKNNFSKKLKGFSWYSNPATKKRVKLFQGEPIPDGYVKGKLKW
jgi:hypothetical protein